jgi:TonB family protein
METLEPAKVAIPETEQEPNFLLERDHRDDWRRWRTAATVSAAFHITLTLLVLLWPESETKVYELPPPPKMQIVHLYTPRDLTQKDPNKGKINKEITLATIPAPATVKSPSPPPPPKQGALPPPSQQAHTQPPKPIFVEPPKIESPKTQPDSQTDQLAKLNAPPAIEPPTQQPKIVFENPVSPPPPPPSGGKPGGALALPNPSVSSAIHELATGGTVNGHQSVGDTGTGMGGANRTLPASPGSLPANIELLSNPTGVDFRPYLIQVLAAVRRSWFAVYPEAAKTGLRGQAVLEFAIGTDGKVNKVIYDAQTGSRPLDEAAVAALSASNPLPPLPKEYKGDRIVLRMTFMYNMQR